MQVSVEKKQGIQCVFNIELPANEIDQEVSNRIKKIAKTAKMDGFRPGKVPVNMIKEKHGAQVRLEVIGDILPQKYNQALSDENLTAAGAKFEITQNEEGKALKFNVNVELFPEINITNLEKIEIKQPVVTLGDAETEKMVGNIRQQFTTWHEIERPVLNNDKVVIDFVGHIDGKEFKGGKDEAFELLIGSNQMIPGFEEGIINMEKDQKKTITATFPENYQTKELAGREAKFDITVTAIKAPKLPELDEDFFKELGIKGDISTFYKEIKENMARELKLAVAKSVKRQAFSGLSQHIDVEIPQSLVDIEIKNMKENLIKRSGAQQSKLKAEKLPNDLFEKQAKESVKISLIVNAIVEQQKFQADQKSIDHALEEMTAVYEDPAQMRKQLQANNHVMNNVKSSVIEDQVVAWVVSQAKTSEQSEDFFDLVQKTT